MKVKFFSCLNCNACNELFPYLIKQFTSLGAHEILMGHGIISDNWSLQDVSSLLNDGLSPGDDYEIAISDDFHNYSPVSSAAIQTEALFDFLTDLILRDEIIVEEKFTHTWDQEDSPILQARDLGIIKDYPFTADYKKLESPKAAAIKMICVTDSLKSQHQENVEGWKERKEIPHSLLSMTLWGGAGMLSRAYVYKRSYTPHPLRRKLFVNSGFLLSSDAAHRLNELIKEKRFTLSNKILGGNSIYSMFVNVPPLPLSIINECNHPAQFVNVALQMRDEFKDLREWLKMFQNAITNDNIAKIRKYSGVLESVSEYIDNSFGIKSSDNVTMSAGLGIFKMSKKWNPVNSLQNRFGIRSTINKLILNETGKKAITKYSEMFGEKGTDIGYTLEQYFSNNTPNN